MTFTNDDNPLDKQNNVTGLGDHAYVLPLLYSLLAGLSTGIGGLLCLLVGCVCVCVLCVCVVYVCACVCVCVCGCVCVCVCGCVLLADRRA